MKFNENLNRNDVAAIVWRQKVITRAARAWQSGVPVAVY